MRLASLRAGAFAAVFVAALFSMSCDGASDEAVASLEPLEVVTGWYDDGIIQGGKNKLVPSVTMKLRNKGAKELKSIQINAIFRRVGEQEMWGEYFGWAVPRSEPLPAGAAIEDVSLKKITVTIRYPTANGGTQELAGVGYLNNDSRSNFIN